MAAQGSQHWRTHLDLFTWTSDFARIPYENFKAALDHVLKQKDWIIEGWAYHEVLKERLLKADVIIYLDYSLDVCLSSAVTRNRQYQNKPYPFDPFNGNRNVKEQQLIMGIHYVHEKLRPEAISWLKDLQNTKTIFTYTSREELNNDLDEFKAALYAKRFPQQ